MESPTDINASKFTYVVELTPLGRASVAVVLVAGPDASPAVAKNFVPFHGRLVADSPIGRIAFGHWGGESGEELIVCRRSKDQIEIHCHGGAAAVRAVISSIEKEGCQPITWQDWIRQSSPDPISAAARIALADAVTERTAAILVDQLNGALAEAIRETIGQVRAANWSAAARILDELLGRRALGLHLIKPWRVVVLGAPNVGKSSLVNALAGYERAIVSTMPGTTRDVVTVTIAMDGWPVQLADTAGLRATEDELESAGIELATTTASDADLILWVHDATRLNDELQLVATQCEQGSLASTVRAIRVINKIDLLSNAERSNLRARLDDPQAGISNAASVSAQTGEGIAELVAAIGRMLTPVLLPAGSAVPFTVPQLDRLAAAREAVGRRDASAVIELLQALLRDRE